MELELTSPVKVVQGDREPVGLRAVDAPLAGTTTTWAMDLVQEDLPLPTPAAHCKLLGFWNDMPEEEQREVVELMPPTYGKKRYVNSTPMVIDVKEMATVLIGIYLMLALVHMVLLIVRL